MSFFAASSEALPLKNVPEEYDGDLLHRELENFLDRLGGDGIEAGTEVGAAAVENDGTVRFQLGDGLGMVQAGQTAALHDHGKALADLPVGIVGDFLFAPLDHVAALGNGLV